MRLPALVAALVFTAAAHAGPADTIKTYPAAEIAPGVHAITGPLGEPSVDNQGFMNNPAWIVAGDQVVVVDPGSSVQAGRMVVAQIRKATSLPVTAVFNTHVHGDHWLGNQAILEAWPKALLIGHPDMIAQAQSGQAAFWVDMMKRLTAGYTDGTVAKIPMRQVNDGEVLKFGTRSFTVLASNDAHSKTDLMLLTDTGVLFTGDNVLNGRVARMDDGTFTGNIREIERAITAKPQHVVPGHGAPGGAEVLTAQRDFFQTLVNTVKAEYDAGRSDFEMKPAVNKALAAFTHWHGYDDAIGRQISLVVLEIEAQ
jgi:glyoxylase-like metal-dependent hydrolase (beta-lactamase superfamily II)